MKANDVTQSSKCFINIAYILINLTNKRHLSSKIVRNHHWKVPQCYILKKNIFHCFIASLPFPLSERSQTHTQERADTEEKDFVTSKVTLLLGRASWKQSPYAQNIPKDWKKILKKINPAKLLSYIICTNTVFRVTLT